MYVNGPRVAAPRVVVVDAAAEAEAEAKAEAKPGDVGRPTRPRTQLTQT